VDRLDSEHRWRSQQGPRRRWARRLGVAIGGLLVLTTGVYLWATLSTDSSTIARALVWREADVGDQDRFPSRPVPAGSRRSPLATGARAELDVATAERDRPMPLDDVLAETDTRAFLVIHDDAIVFERYFDDSGVDKRETSFSVGKSVLSTLIGIAITEGEISNLGDPITEYVPELADRDERFSAVTLRDLLTMRSGLRYEESGFPFPWGDDTDTYYGVDLRAVALDGSEIESPPSVTWHYNNYNALLLGLALERATGMSVSRYTSSRLWQPLGAAAEASWSVDSDDSGFEKMESGFNATARDYARLGLLFLHRGRWNGRRVVPTTWVRAATRAQTETTYDNQYGFFWWVDGERPRRFYALGNLGQYIYVAPDADTVVVRLGSEWGLTNPEWLEVFRQVARFDHSGSSHEAG